MGFFSRANKSVPSTLRLEMRKILHQDHLGIEKTKWQARQSLFWPNMNAYLKDTISYCKAFQLYKNHQGAEPLKNHEAPDKPWTKVGTDLLKIQGRTYLIVVDYYSKYFKISKLLNNTSLIVIKRMKAMFPKLVFSDNGPEFTSLEFRKFSPNWDIEHDTSILEFVQSNGMVERTIQTV